MPNAKRAVRGRLVLSAKIACRANTVRVTWVLLAAHNAPLDLVNTIQDRRRAFHAAPANSTMMRVLLVANYVSTQPTLVAKEEKAVASTVQQVGLPKTAVQNVLRAGRVRLALGVKSVHWVLPEKETTMMRRNANTAKRVKQQQWKVPLNAMLVKLVRLAATKVFAKHARLGSIKIPKVKRIAVPLASRLEKYPTTQAPGVNCHRGVPAKWVNI